MFLIPLIFLMLILTLLAALVGMRLYDNHKVVQIRNAVERVQGEGHFSEAMIAGLPEAVQRYFRHAIAPGTLLASRVLLHMNGKLARTPGGKCLPMAAEEILTGRVFVWQGSQGRGLTKLLGNEMYVAKTSRQLWWWGNAVPWTVRHGGDHARFAAAHAAMGRLWLPSTLLPMFGVQWAVAGDDAIVAVFQIDEFTFTLKLEISAEGAVRSAFINRWGRLNEKQAFAEHVYGVVAVGEEKTFAGFTVPGKADMGWVSKEEDPRIVYSPEIVEADYR